MIPTIAKNIGRKKTYSFSLLLGGIGLASMCFIHDKNILLLSISGVGLAWAAILAMPYAMLSGSLPADKMGVYMGLFNATITVPQIAAGLLGSTMIALFGGFPMAIIVIAGVSMLIAGLAVFFVNEKISTAN
jgi:maltose/moltooligosaccharide transporter